jgi:hypothetical protein
MKLYYSLCSFAKFLLFISLFWYSGCGGNCYTEDKFLIITTYAGMGNRLRILSSAKVMAAVTGRQLIVDWPLLKKEMPGFWSDFFLNPLINYEQSSLYRQGCPLRSIYKASKNDPNIENLGDQNDATSSKTLADIPAITKNIVYFGTSLPFRPEEQYLSSSEYREKIRLFYRNLDPVKWITDEVNAFKKQYNLDKYFMIGVHYRAWNTGAPDVHGKLISDLEMRYLPDFIQEMKKALAMPLADTDQKEVAFFIASDKKEVKEKLTNEPSFKGHVFYRDIPADRSTIDGQRSDLVEFFLLGETNYIIGTYQSSYSDEAANLTKQGRKINIGQAAYK